MLVDFDIVSREINDKINAYIDLLLKWNRKINLISSSTIQDIKDRHVLDSIQLLNYISDLNIKLIDFGSGAGFPAMLLSYCGVREVVLIESDQRKSAFLIEASKISDNKIEIINDRIEKYKDLSCDIVTARAFNSLSSIFELSDKFCIKDKYLLHKGKTYRKEILQAKNNWLFDLKEHASITDQNAKILEISNVKRI